MGELIQIKKKEIENTKEQEYRVVEINLTSADKGKAMALLNQVIDGFQILRDRMPEVEPEKRYYLDLTKEMKDKLESGEAWFTEKAATGKRMGQLRHRVDGKNVIMANPEIIEEQIQQATPKGDPHQMANGIYQMALQQQMAEMSHKLDAIQKTVKRIESGQMDDRFAKIEAGEQTLRVAYAAKDEENRRKLVTAAIPQLQEGSEAIKLVIKRRISEFEPIPSKGRSMRLKMWMSPTNYVEKKNREFDAIQDCFEYYDRAQKLLAISCMMLEERESMQQIFFQQEKFIKELDTWKLKSMKHLHYNIDFTGEWFCSPKEYLNGTRLQYLDFTEENYDMVSIEVTGRQMLEVLENDQDAGSEESTEEE